MFLNYLSLVVNSEKTVLKIVYIGIATNIHIMPPIKPAAKITKNISNGCAFNALEKIVGFNIRLSIICTIPNKKNDLVINGQIKLVVFSSNENVPTNVIVKRKPINGPKYGITLITAANKANVQGFGMPQIIIPIPNNINIMANSIT